MATTQYPLSPVSSLDTEEERQARSPRTSSKPLPRLPRGWARICYETGLFLRSIGLGLFVTTLQGLFSRGFSEPTKVAIRRNRVTALLRLIIHIVPMGVALAEIVLNTQGRYIGATFTKQNYYQFAAKAHEITIQASLSAIFLSFIRSRLISEDGLPLGAFLGGLQFLQVSYLWSTELWSSISFTKTKLLKSLMFLISVTVLALLAATAGPSSATLLIPRQNQWPQRSQRLSINGSVYDIWPDHISSDDVPSHCASVSSSKPDYQCPSADWAHLPELLSVDAGLFESWDDVGVYPTLFLIYDPTSTFQKGLAMGICRSDRRNLKQMCASCPQQTLLSPISDEIQSWYKNVPSSLTFTDVARYIQKDYWEPYVVTSCVSDTISSSNNQELLQFARISETSSELQKDREVLPVPNLRKNDTITIPGNSSDFRVKWIELPQNLFAGQPLGAIILHPHNATSEHTQNVTTCTMSAGWGTSLLYTDTLEQDLFTSSISNVPKSWPVQSFLEGPQGSWDTPDYANLSGFAYPQRRMTISATWAEFLNPVTEEANSSHTTPINSILSSTNNPSEEFIAAILSILVTSGLSWTGGHLESKLLDKDEAPCPTCTVFEVSATITGWSYSINGTTNKLALVVMLAYCIIALAHIIYSGITGLSSTAWDSIGEVIALAMNSSPSAHLQNTCAGIIGTKAYKTNVRVVATKGDHLELVFGETTQDANFEEMEVNREYGRLTLDEHRYEENDCLVNDRKED